MCDRVPVPFIEAPSRHAERCERTSPSELLGGVLVMLRGRMVKNRDRTAANVARVMAPTAMVETAELRAIYPKRNVGSTTMIVETRRRSGDVGAPIMIEDMD